MKRPFLVNLFILIIVFLAVSFIDPVSFAADRFIPGTASTSLTKIIRDDIRDRVYLISDKYLFVIDADAEKILIKIPITGPVNDMAVNKSFSILDVAGGGMVTRIDLNQLIVLQQYSIPGVSITSVSFDYQNNPYVFATSPSLGNSGWIYKLNSTGTQVLQQFGIGTTLDQQVYDGLVRTDATGTILYVGELGLSPMSITKINILDANSNGNLPIYEATNGFGALGSNLEDFAISPRYNQLYVAAGSPYGIQVVDSNSLALIKVINTAAYPDGVSVSLLGDSVYGISNTDNSVYEINPVTLKLTNTYTVEPFGSNGSTSGIALDRFGDKAFVIDGFQYPGAKSKVEVIDVQGNMCT